MDSTRSTGASLHGLVALCMILLAKNNVAQAYKPKHLEDFTSVQGSVLFGSRVRYDVINLAVCVTNVPVDMNVTEFSMEIQSAEINSDQEYGTIVSSTEHELLNSNSNEIGFLQRQVQVTIRADGSAFVSITDFQPVTFKVARHGELFCTWKNYTAFNMTRGIIIWEETWQATEIGTMDRLQEADHGGNLIFFYINANQLLPPQYRSHWCGYVQDFKLKNNTSVFYSRHMNQAILLVTELVIQPDANATINRYVIDRTTNAYVTEYTMKGVVGYDTAIHFYWTGLF